MFEMFEITLADPTLPSNEFETAGEVLIQQLGINFYQFLEIERKFNIYVGFRSRRIFQEQVEGQRSYGNSIFQIK